MRSYCNGKLVGAPKKALGKTADEAETSKYGQIRMFVNIVNFELSHCCLLIFIGRHADIDSLFICNNKEFGCMLASDRP